MFFQEKEGTSPVVRLLDKFDEVCIVRAGDSEYSGWEPFDRRNVGSMSLQNFGNCLDMIFGSAPADMTRLNAIYQKSGRHPLSDIDTSRACGFKMRFKPTWDLPGWRATAASRNWPGALLISEGLKRLGHRSFERLMLEKLREHNVVVFIAVRQDLLRWGLSKYHGDGTGKKGHMQFKMARGKLDPSSMQPIEVDVDRLGNIIESNRKIHDGKRALISKLQASGIAVYPVRYEHFSSDPIGYFVNLFGKLDIPVDSGYIESTITDGTKLKKVHSDDISTFVANHEEVMGRFGNAYSSWEDV